LRASWKFGRGGASVEERRFGRSSGRVIGGSSMVMGKVGADSRRLRRRSRGEAVGFGRRVGRRRLNEVRDRWGASLYA
jgi:hypothetical protein